MIKTRKQIDFKLKRVVVKIGSSGISQTQISRLARDIAQLCENGIEPIVVSSGAIALGKDQLKNFNKTNVNSAQAAAAIGQPILMNYFQVSLRKYNLSCAQVLLTHDDLKNHERYLNSRNTLLKLIENKTIPILNENDSVSFDEIKMGDNDQIAGQVAVMLEADLLLLLTESDGLYSADPKFEESKKIKFVDYENTLKNIKTHTKTSLGSGGMLSKLRAVKKISSLGGTVIISSHQKPKPILRAISSEVGTYFFPKLKSSQKKKKNWIFSNVKYHGKIYIDQGAKSALFKNGSLLPIGIKKIEGKFKRGDCVEVYYKQELVGVGLAEYDFEDVNKICGKKSCEIVNHIKEAHSFVFIHRDNLYINQD